MLYISEGFKKFVKHTEDHFSTDNFITDGQNLLDLFPIKFFIFLKKIIKSNNNNTIIII